MKEGNVNILGTQYNIKVIPPDEYMIKNNYVGVCDYLNKLISISDFSDTEDINESEKEIRKKEVLRHEIIHAFFNESGLQWSALAYDGAWSKNEEMVDWFAIQLPKIYEVMKSVECI